jgi:ribosome-binding protein aMBF1 (putative translation factor)
MSNFQDWTPINIGNNANKSPKKSTSPKNTVSNNGASNIVCAADKPLDMEDTKITLVDKDFAKQITTARLVKKMTQAQIAHALSLDVNIIKTYENGTAKHNGPIVSKLKKYYNIHK